MCYLVQNKAKEHIILKVIIRYSLTDVIIYGEKIEAGKFSNVKLTLHIDLTMHVSVLQWS